MLKFQVALMLTRFLWKVIGSTAYMHRLILPKPFYPNLIDFFLYLYATVFVFKFGFVKRKISVNK